MSSSTTLLSFSALQRAENSSTFDLNRACGASHALRFQCSSASRKFLNRRCDVDRGRRGGVSVLFSEPKIPQPQRLVEQRFGAGGFSALQRAENSSTHAASVRSFAYRAEFQCSSASRKFLNHVRDAGAVKGISVSVLFSEPKIPQPLLVSSNSSRHNAVSVLFSEPKIPQPTKFRSEPRWKRSFSALQRAENSST